VELSRRFRALKIWLTCVIRYAPYCRGDQRRQFPAEYLASIVQIAEDFELLAPVELSNLLLSLCAANP